MPERVASRVDPHLPCLLPCIAVTLLIRQITSQTGDDATWPTMKKTLGDALRMHAQMRRRAWWN
ncbi:MAG TPA: hypothetical protein VE966_03515 [Gemmatimonadales bacterium]|jgi:hypothetical protein|nr:hypothetical protein [Gemmatimonadales bacterium]